jgi:hypothetical protein
MTEQELKLVRKWRRRASYYFYNIKRQDEDSLYIANAFEYLLGDDIFEDIDNREANIRLSTVSSMSYGKSMYNIEITDIKSFLEYIRKFYINNEDIINGEYEIDIFVEMDREILKYKKNEIQTKG